MPASITPTVSPETITKVTRLFNGSLTDILNELFQNARRAGASFVAIDYVAGEAVTHLTVSDDGCGIADPARLLALGSSGWGEDTAAREDPAGMGVFALAGKAVTIISRHAGAADAWSLTIPADGWTGAVELPLEPATHAVGTTIVVELAGNQAKALDQAARGASRFYPLPVLLKGEELPREDFLADAENIVAWNGSWIGIFRGSSYRYLATVNFHGVTVAKPLASIAESRGGNAWYAKLDIGNTPALQLVLPARKELIENDALADLQDACERAIYATIASKPFHRLAFEQWSRARALGVEMPEATPRLARWTPAQSDNSTACEGGGDIIVGSDTVLVEDLEPHTGQPLAHALANHPLRPNLADQHAPYEGYNWYDALPTLRRPRFHIHAGEAEHIVSDAVAEPPLDDHLKADSIELRFTITRGPEATEHAVPATIVFDTDQDCWYESIDHLRIIWTGDTLTPEDAVELLEKVAFSPSDDNDADSWDTQHEYFTRQARRLATETLLGEDAAICGEFRDLIFRNRWLLPEGRGLTISISGNRVEVQLAAMPQAA